MIKLSTHHRIKKHNVDPDHVIQSCCYYGTLLGCALFWCWVLLGALVTISLIEFYFFMIFIMIVVTIFGIFMVINYFLKYILCFLYLSSSAPANAQLPRCFCPWTFSLNIGLNMLPLDSFMSCLHSLLGYSTGQFQALQLIVIAAFGGVDQPFASCMLLHFLEIYFKMIVGL